MGATGRKAGRGAEPERFRANLLIIAGIGAGIGILSAFWYLLRRSRGVGLPVSDTLLLFALLVVITILSLILLLMLFRTLIKYYFEGRSRPPSARIKTKLVTFEAGPLKRKISTLPRENPCQ